MKQAFAVLALILVIPASSAFSQPTTISYDAVVTYSWGLHATVFSVGDEVVISYTLDPSVADINPNPGDPVAGSFPNAVLALSVSFPSIGVSAVAGAAGKAQTFDNVVDTPCCVSIPKPDSVSFSMAETRRIMRGYNR
jgi:hypothetical protein